MVWAHSTMAPRTGRTGAAVGTASQSPSTTSPQHAAGAYSGSKGSTTPAAQAQLKKHSRTHPGRSAQHAGRACGHPLRAPHSTKLPNCSDYSDISHNDGADHDEERAARKVHLLLSEIPTPARQDIVMDRTAWNKMLRSIYTN
jgi:hypothetical protein